MKKLTFDVEKLTQDEQETKEEIFQLKNKTEAMIFFNANLEGLKTFGQGQNVVYENVLDNLGGCYNAKNGHFVPSLDGFYFFSVSCLSGHNKKYDLSLFHNQDRIFRVTFHLIFVTQSAHHEGVYL